MSGTSNFAARVSPQSAFRSARPAIAVAMLRWSKSTLRPARRTSHARSRLRCFGERSPAAATMPHSYRCSDRAPPRGRACNACAALPCASRREVASRQDAADVAQARERVRAFGRAFRQGRQLACDARRESGKLGSRQAQQVVDCQHSHCFLHRFPAAPIAAFCGGRWRRRRRVHRPRPERQRRSASPSAEASAKAEALAAMQPTCLREAELRFGGGRRTGARWPVKKDGFGVAEMERK